MLQRLEGTRDVDTPFHDFPTLFGNLGIPDHLSRRGLTFCLGARRFVHDKTVGKNQMALPRHAQPLGESRVAYNLG